ncbi:Hypothetical predicted protein [Cloeon dipterum]|uniref:BTB domain-containing protein n=1 Tax=Cloeon dipterum TaxID=197152 RepID=A0A8S1C1W6_9INSE|nr:Hypothetical predicted protein [Cloeon dipterum]
MNSDNEEEPKQSSETKAANSLFQLRWRALQSGKGTDCKLLVGNVTKMYFHACKFDLACAVRCDQFQEFLRNSSPAKPIVIPEIEPHIFKKINRFVHCYVVPVYTENELDELVEMTVAVLKLNIAALVPMYLAAIVRYTNPDNIWRIFKNCSNCKEIMQICKTVVASNPEEYLKQPEFLSIEIFKFMDLFDNADSELIADALIRLAENDLDNKSVLIKAVIPHLKLKKLDQSRIEKLEQYISVKELELNVTENEKDKISNFIKTHNSSFN